MSKEIVTILRYNIGMNRLLLFFLSIGSLFAGEVDLYFTASINGNLDGCECPDRPRAGLVTSAQQIAQRDRESSLFFIGGDWMDLYPDRELHQSMVQVFELLQPDVVALGDQDLSEGLPWILEQDLALQSNNLQQLMDESAGPAPLGLPAGILERQNLRIAVLSLADRRAFSDARQMGLQFSDPLAMARDFCDSMDTQADLLVLLFHGYEDRARSIAALCPELDVIYLSHEQQIVQVELGDTLLLSPGQDGNNLSILTVEKRWGRISMDHRLESFVYEVDPVFPPAREIVDNYYNSMYGNINQ